MEMITTSRRGFLKSGGALVVTFAVGSSLPVSLAQAASAAKTVSPNEVDGFLAIAKDGNVTVFSGKVDLGTGVRTALSQMAAEELDVPVSRITIIEGDSALTPDQGTTSGSLSIQNGGMQIRRAAATARQALLRMASEKLGVPAADLVVRDGVIKPKAGGAGVSYGDLIGGRNFALAVDKDVKTKSPSEYTIVGKSVPRIDIPAKVTGQFTYMQDFRLPGMVHARVVRPPAIGAALKSVDESSVKNIPGLIQVVRHGNFLAVVAKTEWAAIKAARQIKAAWSDWAGLPDQAKLWDHVRSTKIVKDAVTSEAGNVAEALPKGAKRLKATYDFPIHTHGSIGPSCAVAEIKDGKLTCWTASQGTHALRRQLAQMLEMKPEDVRTVYLDGAGCYGRNGHEDAAADAALLARLTGRPVRVQWTREDEHGWDPKGPPTLVDLRGAVDEAGNLIAWDAEFWHPKNRGKEVALVAADHAGLPTEDSVRPGNVNNNSDLPYALPNVRTVVHELESTPFRASWIRTPGRLQNTFANEAFLDELAAAAGADPLAFRLRYLKDPRGIEVLTKVATLAKWEERPSPRRDRSGDIVRGRGVTYCHYNNAKAYVAAVAEVAVNQKTGAIRVERFFVTHDLGQIINPDGLKNQIEGNIVQTVSRTMKEELLFDRSRVTSVDWASYPILTMPEVPDVVIELIDRPDITPLGGGEPSAAVVPSAISNAVFDATGVRLRSVPFTPARFKAAQAI